MKHIFLSLILALSIGMPVVSAPIETVNSQDVSFLIDDHTQMDAEVKPVDEIPEEDNIAPLATTTYDTYMEAYFRGLRRNMGENYKGSCGYVALGEILSYYDSFLNDNIIQEKYDVASTGTGTDMISRAISPGILNDTVSYSEYSKYGVSAVADLSAKDYYTIISSKVNSSLHAKLITLGNDLGYYDYSDNDDPCGTSYTDRVKILNKYLSEIGLTSADYTIRTYSGTSANVEKFIKENIDNGYPVLTSLYSSTRKAGHAVVCYDYDSSKIYCNMGWSGSSSYAHYDTMARYDTYRNAMVVEFNYNHTHSLNYQVTSSGKTTSYCYCNCNILTYKSLGHDYTDHYVDNDDNFYHKSYCRCGDYILEKHSWNNIVLLDLSYDPACKQCGAIKKPSTGGTLISL